MFDWSEERIDQLKAMLGTMSAAQIADKLGCGRNAVLGKSHRLGLSNPVPSEVRRARAMKAVKTRGGKPKKVRRELNQMPWKFNGAELTELPPEVSPFACTLMELQSDSCRWPQGDPSTAELRFCGAPKVMGAYCAGHARLAFNVSAKPTYVYKYWRQFVPS